MKNHYAVNLNLMVIIHDVISLFDIFRQYTNKFGVLSMTYKNTFIKGMFCALPLLLSACMNDGVISTSDQVAPTVLSSLPAQKMDKGECITFLWAEQANRPLIFTHNIKDDSATILIGQESVNAIRTNAKDNIIPAFYANQVYKAENSSIEVKLKPEQAHNIYEGIKIPAGLISIQRPDGSQDIIPVSGMLGCNMES